MSRFDRDTHDATTSRFHNVATDDGVVGPIGALHQHVGLQVFYDVVRCLLVEDGHAINTFEPRKNLGTLMLRRDGAIRTLVRPNRSVRVDSDDEDIAERTSLLQIPHVPGMQEIEYTVREDHTMSGIPGICGEQTRVRAGEHCHGTSLLKTRVARARRAARPARCACPARLARRACPTCVTLPASPARVH